MFILFHLVTGLVIGYLLADRLNDQRVVLPCILGALLPDLVDKPLGFLVFGDTIGTGRIYLHTLLFFLLLLSAGMYLLRTRRSSLLLALGIGVVSHQVLDLMWEEPRAWLYPFLGPFTMIDHEDWFFRALLLELQNPIEWVSGLLLCLLLLPFVLPSVYQWLTRRAGRSLRMLGLVAVPMLAAAGCFIMSRGILHQYTPLTGWHEPLYNVLGGVVVILAALAAYRFSQGGLGSEGGRAEEKATDHAT